MLCVPLSSSIIWGCQGWLKALLAAAGGGTGKAYVGHTANKRTAARCLAGALGSLHHFNYASDLLQVPFCLAAHSLCIMRCRGDKFSLNGARRVSAEGCC